MSSRRLQGMSSRRLQDMSSRRLQDMSSRRLEDVFSGTIFRLPRRLQDTDRYSMILIIFRIKLSFDNNQSNGKQLRDST